MGENNNACEFTGRGGEEGGGGAGGGCGGGGDGVTRCSEGSVTHPCTLPPAAAAACQGRNSSH